jgi:hypothetical protein
MSFSSLASLIFSVKSYQKIKTSGRIPLVLGISFVTVVLFGAHDTIESADATNIIIVLIIFLISN